MALPCLTTLLGTSGEKTSGRRGLMQQLGRPTSYKYIRRCGGWRNLLTSPGPPAAFAHLAHPLIPAAAKTIKESELGSARSRGARVGPTSLRGRGATAQGVGGRSSGCAWDYWMVVKDECCDERMVVVDERRGTLRGRGLAQSVYIDLRAAGGY